MINTSSKNHKSEKCKEHKFEIRVFGKVKKNVCTVCGFKQDIPKEKKGKPKVDPETKIESKKMSILKALKELAPSKNFTAKEIIDKIREKYPDFEFKDISISLHLTALDVNNEKAKTSNPSLAKNAFLIKVEKGVYKRV